MGYAEAQPGFLRAGEVLAKRGHIDIVSTRGATMVGGQWKFFGIWTLQIGLKCPSQALFRGKVTFKIRDFCLFLTLYYKKRAQLLNIFFWAGEASPPPPGCTPELLLVQTNCFTAFKTMVIRDGCQILLYNKAFHWFVMLSSTI